MPSPRSKKKLKAKRINSRQKGAQGEREFAELLRVFGYTAKRGQQHAGGVDSPDVIHSVPNIHFEVKRVQVGSVHDWLAQATRDAAVSDTPVVAHRRNGKQWVASLSMRDFLNLVGNSTEL